MRVLYKCADGRHVVRECISAESDSVYQVDNSVKAEGLRVVCSNRCLHFAMSEEDSIKVMKELAENGYVDLSRYRLVFDRVTRS